MHFVENKGRLAHPDFAPTSTTRERSSFAGIINLADAHCRQPLAPAQRRIVDRLPQFFIEAQQRSQLELEEEFIAAFLRLAGEAVPADTSRHLLSYSASSAITMLASHCARSGKRVALLEPAFDNIPSILRRERVELERVRESDCAVYGAAAAAAATDAEVVWLVSPNNPTGWTLDQAQLGELAQECQRRGRTLVLDMSFRFFAPQLVSWSQYEVLDDCGVSYVVLEDTGKTWPTNEMKVALTVCSADMFPDLYRLHDDLLQSVSPFHLRVLTELIRETRVMGSGVGLIAQRNRAILREVLAPAPLSFRTAMTDPISVDWLSITAPFGADELVTEAMRSGVHILPGANFFWQEPQLGAKLVRIALARDPDYLRAGAEILCRAACELAAAR